jgi:hypothetical protein
VPLRQFLTQHEVVTAYERGWSQLSNGELLQAAEADGFDLFITTDSNLKYQQNLSFRRIAIVVLSTPSWPRIQRSVENVFQGLNAVAPGAYIEVSIP